MRLSLIHNINLFTIFLPILILLISLQITWSLLKRRSKGPVILLQCLLRTIQPLQINSLTVNRLFTLSSSSLTPLRSQLLKVPTTLKSLRQISKINYPACTLSTTKCPFIVFMEPLSAESLWQTPFHYCWKSYRLASQR